MFSKKWLALICGYLVFLASAVAFFQFPPLINQINETIPLSDIDIGLIQGFYALPAVLLAIVGGILLDSIDSRHAGIISGFLLLLGNLIFTFGGSIALMLVGRLLVGIATIIINLVAAKMMTVWFDSKQRGFSMSILHTAWPIAAGISYSFFGNIGLAIGWQNLLLVVCGFIAVTLLLFIFYSPADPDSNDKEADTLPKSRISQITKLPASLWLTSFAWFMFTGAMIGVLTFGAKHMESLGHSYQTGSAWVGLLMLSAIPGSLIAGHIIDRFGSLRFYLHTTSVITGIFVLLFVLNIIPWLMMLLAGLFATFIPICVYGIPGEIVSPKRLGVAFGLILTFSNLGNTIMPVIYGWINQLAHNHSLSLFVVASMMMLISAIAFTINLKKPSK